MSTEKKSVLFSLQYLRFFAAAIVVITHATNSAVFDFGANSIRYFQEGARGVDIFFFISGFIMVYITESKRSSPLSFFLDRITRVAPLYWLCSAVVVLIVVFFPSLMNSGTADPVHVVTSFLFIPWAHPNGGEIQPVLRLGWTLNLEFFFYSLFALAMAVSFKYRILISSILISILVMFGIMAKDRGPVVELWTSLHLAQFACGMLIAHFCKHKVVLGFRMSILGILFGLPFLVLFPSGLVPPSLEFLLVSVACLFVVSGALGLEIRGKVPVYPSLRWLGDASYALYLTHMFVIGVVRFLWGKAFEPNWMAGAALVLTALLVSILVSVIVFERIEKPLTRFARESFKPSVSTATK